MGVPVRQFAEGLQGSSQGGKEAVAGERRRIDIADRFPRQQRFEALKYPPGFQVLTWAGSISASEAPASYYIDNLRLANDPKRTEEKTACNAWPWSDWH